MSITDELRNGGTHLTVTDRRAFGEEELTSIADRIDREHRMALEKVAADAFLDGAPTEAQLEELGWIRLPVDADGVPIRPGDELVIFETGEHIRAYDIELYDDGRWCVGDYETMDSIHPDRLRHRAQTVEDVLDEFANAVLGCDNTEDSVQRVIAEYAAKIRLAEEVDA